ncbi:MAG TPA: DUF4149 domain-containing protein [Candidatus Binataceae bacterium]|nr:DUF4149 domain-containing protein [Candidatus Binataceae bacterium]
MLFIYLLALAIWIGAIVFFSFFTAPAVFQNLPRSEAGTVVGAIFPRYYALGYVAGAISLAAAVYFAMSREARVWWSGAAITLAIALGISVYAGAAILPRAHALRAVVEQDNPDPERKAEFDQLHRLSVILNGSVLLLDLAALAISSGALNYRG